jgi:hypothetical protein
MSVLPEPGESLQSILPISGDRASAWRSTMPTCSCACHGAYAAACDIEGGCGSVGCDYGADPEPSARRCARGEYCAYKEPVRDADGRHTGSWLPARIPTERGVCETCVRVVTDALNHLTGDVVELTMLIGRVGVGGEVVVMATPDLKIPIQVNLEALRAEIDSELQSWAEPVAEALGVEWDTTAMAHTRLAVRAQRAARLLANAVDTLLALPEQEHPAWEDGEPKEDPDEPGVQATTIRDGVEGALALLHLHRLAYAAAGRTEYRERIVLPCTRCGLRTLVRRNGEDHVECDNCHERTPWEKIPFLCRVLIDCERALEEERQRQGVPA